MGANLGGQLVDAMLGAVKVGLVAGLGLTIGAAVRAAKGEQLRGAFEGITKSVGTNATAALEKFRGATRGLVNDLDLIQTFNQAIQLQSVKTADEFARLSESAITLGRAVGRNPVESIQDLTLGLGRMSPRILDNLGIIIDAEAAYENYAQSLGKSSDQLTDSERRTAFLNAALARMKELASPLETNVESLADKFQRFKTTLANVYEQAGQPLLGILGELIPEFDRIAKSVGNFLSDNRVKIAEGLSVAMRGVVDAVKKAADYLQERGLAGAFEDAKRVAEDLWMSFREGAVKAIAFVIGEAEAFIIRLKADLVELGKFDVLERFGVRQDGTIGNIDREQREIDTRASQNAARGRAELRAMEALGTMPVPIESDVGNVVASATPQMRQVLASSAVLQSDRSNRSLIARAFPEDAQLQGLKESIPKKARDVGIDEKTLREVFSLEAIKNLSLEQTRNIEEYLAEEKKRIEQDKLITLLNGDRVSSLRRAVDYEKTVREEQTNALRDISRLEDEKARITNAIVENIARVAIAQQETTAKIFAAFDRSIEEASRAQQSMIQQFRGAMDSAGSDPALPRNLRLGLQRGERLREREIKNRLRDQFGSLSAGQIAGSVDLQAQVEAGIVATRIGVERPITAARDKAAETEAPKALSEEFAAVMDKAKADFDAAREELVEIEKATIKAIEDESVALIESMDSVEKFMVRATEAYEDSSERLTSLKAQADSLEAKIATVERAVRSVK